MSEVQKYPKRLIEVDLPIRKISEHARREKSIRHGHISTLHIWWARRPLAACRSVVLASLLPDPVDPLCPPIFRSDAARILEELRAARGGAKIAGDSTDKLRNGLLTFIAEFANWDNTTDPMLLKAARRLVEAAHSALPAGRETSRPVVLDPFAGGGSIPLEALRCGADAVASDLNPVAVVLNKVALEYVPRFGGRLAEAVREWGAWVKDKALGRIGECFPRDPDHATPIAYIWARDIQCEGPGCGARVPMLRSLWLARKGSRRIGMKLVPSKAATVNVEIVHGDATRECDSGTVRRGAVTCPCCGFTTPVERVREQLKARHGGTRDARLLCVATIRPGAQGRFYRLATAADAKAVGAAERLLPTLATALGLSPVPDEKISQNELRRISVPLYGMEQWGDVFTTRQSLVLATLGAEVRNAYEAIQSRTNDLDFAKAVATCLSLAVDRQADALSSLVTWTPAGEFQGHTFARQALPMVWDFAEVNPFADASGNWDGATEWVAKVCAANSGIWASSGHVQRASAASHPLPNDSVNAVITDPPYYDAVPYAHLSDFFYVWLRRTLGSIEPDLLGGEVVEKADEIVVDRPHRLSTSKKDIAFYEASLKRAFSEARRILRPDGVAVIVFASKTTASWEAVLQAVVDAGLTVTASWPIDTEREARLAALGQARLGSSIHLVCRPRENADGNAVDSVGDWREVLAELPRRIHEWMPRLAEEGIVGADAIFACLGPALEAFSRYSRVEKVSGDPVSLREYLEHVWAAVSREALSMVFRDAETAGLEPDARLTAIWLWTLGAPTNDSDASEAVAADANSDDDDDAGGSAIAPGFALEFDAARKIAQGLGARLEELVHVAEVKGDQARLLSVVERTKHLFGKAEGVPTTAKKAAKKKQMSLFAELEQAAEAQGWGDVGAPKAGTTTLDRVHQAMLLFGAGRGEALKRFIVEEGVGRQPQFWKLAQSLSALYPSNTDEKRWVDGVLARKKGLGF